ncbi:hypothetical protein HYT18_03125 [Candidatus Microgenomates bacterium]|nr:hypothetical protein [Candidatus Microgenomates bacterium]
MKKILILVIFLISAATAVSAQQNYQLTFPITELGNCNNVQTCKVFCDQPENRESCITFAKSKGLHKDKVNQKQFQLLSLAKTELGCETFNSCKLFCNREENYTRCLEFAQKHGLATPPSAKDEELLTKAKQNLNCDSFESCKALCDQQQNYTKCAALLQDQISSDDRAMFEKYKPLIKEYLGCDSLITCMAFCMNPANLPKCEEFGKKVSEEQGGSSYNEPPEVWCPKISPECKWTGSDCICIGPESCAQHPECTWDGENCACGTTYSDAPPPVQEPGDVWCPKVGPYCVWDGSSCTCWDACVKDGGTWTGTTCEHPDTKQSVYPSPTSEPPDVSCTKNPDCQWTGESCSCTAVQATPTVEQSPQPQVQGVSTNQGLLRQILDFILSQ